MGTSIKTVVFATVPYTATVANNTLTTLTSPAIYLPESSKVFRSCWLTISCDDIVTATGGSSTENRIDFGLGAVAQTTYSNTATLSHSSENRSLMWEVDVTAYFSANWSGTSMATDIEVLVNQTTGTTLGHVNVCVSIHITYEYDDTSATQVKTVWLPLDAPVGALATSKPGTATATVPALDTHCPEASKTYRQIAIWRWGNTKQTAVTDATVSMEIDSAGASVSGNYEGALLTCRAIRFIDTAATSGMDTSTTHSFYIWSDLAAFHHQAVMMMVTYEFDAANSTDMLVSVRLPMQCSPGPDHGSADPLIATIDLWIQEDSVTGAEIAFFPFWVSLSLSSIASFNMRVGSGSYVTYTDTGGGGNAAGSESAMVRNDAAYTLGRGKNTLTFSMYHDDSLQQNGFSGFWVVNYACAVPPAGVSAANKTIETRRYLHPTGTESESSTKTATSVGLAWLPEATWFLAAPFGVVVMRMMDAGLTYHCLVTASDGAGWFTLLAAQQHSSNEAGWKVNYSCEVQHFLHRWADDSGAHAGMVYARRDPAAVLSRIEMIAHTGTARWHLGTLYTYHSITYSVAGDIDGSNGGTVTIDLHRASDGELLATTSRVGDGAFSLTWYDNTEDVFVSAYEDDTHVGRSAPALAGT